MTLRRGVSGETRPLAFRVLAVPVSGHGRTPMGVLVLLRSPEASSFGRLQLSIGKHLTRHMATLLETDLDILTSLHSRSSAQEQVEA